MELLKIGKVTMAIVKTEKLFAPKSRLRAALARLSAPGHHYPLRSLTSILPPTSHTYPSTTHLRPTSAYPLILSL